MVIAPKTRTAHGLSVDYAAILMARPSITPTDAGCQSFLRHRLKKLGFECVQQQVQGVSNLVAKWGCGDLNVAFSGHTDVVSPGPLARWNSDPFAPVIADNRLYGRGAADMKTGVAAMLAATERVLNGADPTKVTLWWLITSDEEGEAEFGSRWIKSHLDKCGVELDMCIVGEPTALHATGDTIKVGRRGSLSACIDVCGKQGHVAYPHSAVNAIHKATAIIHSILAYDWDTGSEDFPGTSVQITQVDSGAFTDNLVPGQCKVNFNVRYSHQFSETSLKSLLQQLVASVDDSAEISWSRPCEAYFSQPRNEHCLIGIIESAIVNATGRYPTLSTSGGTSDGRFYANSRTQVVEVGVPNETIHQVNESVHLSDVLTLEDIYADILTRLVN